VQRSERRSTTPLIVSLTIKAREKNDGNLPTQESGRYDTIWGRKTLSDISTNPKK